ncbi:hypothetical protein SNE35_29795 [Paucibacter sp. R3-3]|uniref:Uncharacterized protein n=1 Tax=Roseateles agri TaxID=3098619 RepID=A0ABU5DQY1_9BURK|nr:hypothetical protein [Paucibacter sp. R3-3]MDY0748729.1 hypothetical protein [Paucibacter sp. R3-3]
MRALLCVGLERVTRSFDLMRALYEGRLPVHELLDDGLLCHAQTLEDLLARQSEKVDILLHSSWRIACHQKMIRKLLGPLGHRMRCVGAIQSPDRATAMHSACRRWQIPLGRLVVLDEEALHVRSNPSYSIEDPPEAGVVAVLDKLDMELWGILR